MYKHKVLNVIAELTNTYPPFYRTSDGVDLPPYYVQKSNDWEEVQPLYVTTDGVKRYEWGGTEWWIQKNNEKWDFLSTQIMKIDSFRFRSGYSLDKGTKDKIFSTKEAAEKWMEENNPKPY